MIPRLGHTMLLDSSVFRDTASSRISMNTADPTREANPKTKKRAFAADEFPRSSYRSCWLELSKCRVMPSAEVGICCMPTVRLLSRSDGARTDPVVHRQSTQRSHEGSLTAGTDSRELSRMSCDRRNDTVSACHSLIPAATSALRCAGLVLTSETKWRCCTPAMRARQNCVPHRSERKRSERGTDPVTPASRCRYGVRHRHASPTASRRCCTIAAGRKTV